MTDETDQWLDDHMGFESDDKCQCGKLIWKNKAGIEYCSDCGYSNDPDMADFLDRLSTAK